jgi:hypothetical protein
VSSSPTTTPRTSTALPSESSSDDVPSSSVDTACGLLSKEDVADAVGGPVQDGVAYGGSVNTSDTAGCTYYSAEDPTDTASIFVYATTARAETMFAAGGTEISGIGDKAVITGNGPVVSIWFTIDDRSGVAGWVTYTGTAEESLTKAEKLAKALVAAMSSAGA